MVFSSDVAGTVTGHATATFLVNGEDVTRSTDGVAPNSDDAVKVFVDGSLVWHKVDGNNQPLGGATFEVCRTHTLNTNTNTYVDTADVCVTVVDDVGPNTTLDEDPAPGEFLLTDLVLGRYTVRETAAPTGYTILNPNPVQAPDMTLADPDVEITAPFVNRPSEEQDLFHTQTTCAMFVNGTGDDIADGDIRYGLQGGVINNVSPGVFFFYGTYTVAPGTDAITVDLHEYFNAFEADTTFSSAQRALHDDERLRDQQQPGVPVPGERDGSEPDLHGRVCLGDEDLHERWGGRCHHAQPCGQRAGRDRTSWA